MPSRVAARRVREVGTRSETERSRRTAAPLSTRSASTAREPSGKPRREGATGKRCESKAWARRLLSREVDFRYHASFEQMREQDLSEIVPPLNRDETLNDPRSPEPAPTRSILPASIVDFCRAPLLTPEQERDCFRLMNFLKFRAHALRAQVNPEHPRRSDLKEMERLLARAREVSDRIVQCNLRLVIAVARKFLNSLLPLEELLSSGSSILLGAVSKFDFGRGFRFSTYAQHSLQREFYRLAMIRRRDRNRFVTGSEQAFGGHSDRAHEMRLSDLHFGEVSRLIQCMGQVLDVRERRILEARFGLDETRESKTLSEVALELGMSKERVRQLQSQAVGKVRQMVLDRGLLAELRGELESTETA